MWRRRTLSTEEKIYRKIGYREYDPYFKTALNEALLESVGNGARPVAFLSGWNEKCVNVGRQQELENVLKLHNVHEDDIAVVRRQGGGGATFLTPEGELTWGIVAPEEEFQGGVNTIYEDVCERVAEALAEFGIEARHEPINDVVTENGKISGATLRRSNGAIYIGGTLLLEVNPEEMFRYLDPGEEKMKDKQIETYEERVTSMQREIYGFDRNELKLTLLEKLLKDVDSKFGEFTEEELDRAEELREKYSDKEWVYRK